MVAEFIESVVLHVVLLRVTWYIVAYQLIVQSQWFFNLVLYTLKKQKTTEDFLSLLLALISWRTFWVCVSCFFGFCCAKNDLEHPFRKFKKFLLIKSSHLQMFLLCRPLEIFWWNFKWRMFLQKGLQLRRSCLW